MALALPIQLISSLLSPAIFDHREQPPTPPLPPTSPRIIADLAEAVAYLDEHLGARRGHGGVQHVSGQGVLAVGFDHRTSREGDPLLHTHLIIANRVQGPDGQWTALDGRELYRHRLVADAIVCSAPLSEEVRLAARSSSAQHPLITSTVEAPGSPSS